MEMDIGEVKQKATFSWFVYMEFFLLGLSWTCAAYCIYNFWVPIINTLLHRNITFSELPLWVTNLHGFILITPLLGLLICLLWWGVKKRRWLVPLSFFMGMFVFAMFICYQTFEFMKSMRNFD